MASVMYISVKVVFISHLCSFFFLFSLKVYWNQLVSCVITQRRSELSPLQPASLVQIKKGKKKTLNSLHTGVQMERCWPHSRREHSGFTSAHILAQRNDWGSHRPILMHCCYVIFTWQEYKGEKSSGKGIQERMFYNVPTVNHEPE